MKKLCALILSTVCYGFHGVALCAQPVNITYGYHPYWTGGWNGVIIKHKELWKKYLPKNSKVRFEAHLTGPPMVNALLADKMQIGTMGDMPSLVATTKRSVGDVRLVSVPMFSKGQNCNKIVVPAFAPDFDNIEQAVAWLNDKPFAVHRGTCANMFVDTIISKGAFTPSKRLSMTIEVISSNLEAGKMHGGAAMWEPHARHAVEAGHAKYVATGAPWNTYDADMTLMRQDFIQKHPRAAIGWMKAEIEALQFMIQQPEETVEILHEELTGYDRQTIWAAIYERAPDAIGGDPVTYEATMTFNDRVIQHMKNAYAFLHELKVTKSPGIPENAYNEMPITKALEEMGITAPVGVIKGVPRAQSPYL